MDSDDYDDEQQSLLQQLQRHGEQFCEQFGRPLRFDNINAGSRECPRSDLKDDQLEEPAWEGISNITFYQDKSVPIMDHSDLNLQQKFRESVSRTSGKNFMVPANSSLVMHTCLCSQF